MLWGDFTTLRVRHLRRFGLPMPQVLIGGTPCQGFSVAGLRGGLADDRSNLMLAYVRLAHALAATGHLRFAIWENVPGVLSMRDNSFGCFLGALSGADDTLRSPLERGRWPSAGMVTGPRSRIAWRVLDAQYFGLAQRRERVFVVAGFGDGADSAAVLFERKSGGWRPAASREARQNVAGTLSARASAGGGLGTDFELGGGLIEVPHMREVAHTLRAEGFDASEDGTGRGIPLVVAAYGGNNTSGAIDVAPALNAKGGTGRMDFDSETFITAFDCKAGGNTGFSIGDIPGTLRGAGHGGGHAAVASAFGVRRLMPREAERLQGFPDDYTLIPNKARRRLAADELVYLRSHTHEQMAAIYGVAPETFSGVVYDAELQRLAADGPRYKALGNSMAVPVIRWIGERIIRCLDSTPLSACVCH